MYISRFGNFGSTQLLCSELEKIFVKAQTAAFAPTCNISTGLHMPAHICNPELMKSFNLAAANLDTCKMEKDTKYASSHSGRTVVQQKAIDKVRKEGKKEGFWEKFGFNFSPSSSSGMPLDFMAMAMMGQSKPKPQTIVVSQPKSGGSTGLYIGLGAGALALVILGGVFLTGKKAPKASEGEYVYTSI